MSNTITDQGIKCYRSTSYSVFTGDSMSIAIPVVNGSDAAIDVSSGYNFDFQIKAGNGVTSVLAYTESDSEVTMGNGSITIAIPASVTEGIAANNTLFVAGRLYNTSTGVTVTLVEGTLQAKESIVDRATDIDITALYGLPDALALAEGDLVKLAVVIEPATATDQRVTWASSDDEVATVSTAGLVTAVAAGTCDITVTSVYDGDFTDTCAITVS